ncbi:class I SAM-dependent methyltransferase [Curtobacterium luteum]|uniref:Methyltransferase type 12 n=1 Tax=Curtobacterium luteum TaxID=33881 RepID=A0A175RNY6_9MICO|nr:class I SAM-dependent methyltransferase [Curtobacterium luteum]KTR04654.1 methyltransferase type 12 [Curtobacterium luteum]
MSTDHVNVDWDQARDTNRANWDDRVPIHEGAYDIDALSDPAHRSGVVREDLPVLARWLPGGSLAGLDLCHLQCHIGTDTVSLAREGARVTGVDFSPAALDSARGLADRLGVEATWVETDVLDARAAVTGDFDVVYTSIGTICWLDDLDRWAAQVAALLRPGGVFFIRDGHPALYALDEDADELVARHRYFADGTAQQWDDAGTYVGDGTVANTRTYEWPHPLSEIVNALLAVGLRLRFLDEGRTLPWRFSARMEDTGDGNYVWPGADRDRVPATFTIVATKD